MAHRDRRMSGRRPWVVGVSGASGTPYAAAVVRGLLNAGCPVDLVVSRAARLTLLDETGVAFRDGHADQDLAAWLGRDPTDVRSWAPGDLAAGPSSGTYPTRGMVVVPASTAAVAGIALGLSKDLLQRAADVTLKERRLLVVVPRETPMTVQTLRHLVTLAEAGAVVLPASPGFYAGADSVQRLVDFVAAKVLDVLGVEHDLFGAGPVSWAPGTDHGRRPPSTERPRPPLGRAGAAGVDRVQDRCVCSGAVRPGAGCHVPDHLDPGVHAVHVVRQEAVHRAHLLRSKASEAFIRYKALGVERVSGSGVTSQTPPPEASNLPPAGHPTAGRTLGGSPAAWPRRAAPGDGHLAERRMSGGNDGG